MSFDNSYIKYSRALHYNDSFKGLSYEYRHIFLTILIEMAYKPKVFYAKGQKIELKPGQFFTTFRRLVELCDEKDIDLAKVQRALKTFEKLGFAIQKTIQRKTIITITEPSICAIMKIENDTKTIQDSEDDTENNENEEKDDCEKDHDKEDYLGENDDAIQKRYKTTEKTIQGNTDLSNENRETYNKSKNQNDTRPIQNFAKNDTTLFNRTKKEEYTRKQPQTPSFDYTKSESAEFVRCSFSDLENLDLSDSDKQQLFVYPRERVLLAIEFFQTEPLKKTLIQGLHWHCQQPSPPISKYKAITQRNLWLSMNSAIVKEMRDKHKLTSANLQKHHTKTEVLVITNGLVQDEIYGNQPPEIFAQHLECSIRKLGLYKAQIISIDEAEAYAQ